MTIAAGFVASDGILLCADTEYSGGSIKKYEVKIIRCHIPEGGMAFVIVGNETKARALIRKVSQEFPTNGPTPSLGDIERALSEKSKGLPSTVELLVGVFVKDRMVLFHQRGASLDVIEYFTGAGTGWNLADYIVKGSYRYPAPLISIVPVAIKLLSATKRYCEGVGGPSQFVVIRPWSMSDVMTRDSDTVESQLQAYERDSGALLLNLLNISTEDDVFEQRLADFNRNVRQLRNDWRTNLTFYLDFLRGLNPASPPNPPPPTTDP